MSTEKDFLSLLNSLAQDQHYTISFLRESESIEATFKSLTTLQLKELVKTAVDSPLTQSVFNSTATKVFKQSLVSTSPETQFNVVDRLIFLLQTRIQAISPVKKIKIEDKKTEVEVVYSDLINNLTEALKINPKVFAVSAFNLNNLTITYGVPFIDTEVQLEEEIYKNVEIKIDSAEELRKIVGESFINEIAKSIQTITIQDQTVVLAEVSFKQRLKLIENLPASAIQSVIEYIERYKNAVNECLTIDNFVVPVDSTLFSV